MYAIVDIEATGGRPGEGRMMEVAIVHHDGKQITGEYSTLINPQRAIDKYVRRLTGIDDEMVEDAPIFAQVADEIDEWTRDRIFVAHNVKFDYSFFKHEFARLGKEYKRKNLCTVKLSQKLLPGHQSYSLGKLCSDLNFTINNRHRALGDARATAMLLSTLLEIDNQDVVRHSYDEFASIALPDGLTVEQVNELPEQTGVLYFLNQENEIIYLTQTKNIRNQTLKILRSNHRASKYVASIDFELTGSVLIAQLLEEKELQQLQPKYNHSIRKRKPKYGLYLREDLFGYHTLEVETISGFNEPILEFTRKKLAEEAKRMIRQEYKLYQETRQEMQPDEYNALMNHAIQCYHFKQTDFAIVDKGRNLDEQAVICVKDGKYVGYGYMDMHSQLTHIEDCITQDNYNLSKQLLVSNFIKNKKNVRVVALPTEAVDH